MPFSKIFTKDYNLQKIQDNVANAIQPLDTSPFSGAILLTKITLKAGQDNLISHTLGVVPKFWILAGIDQSANVWQATSSQLQNQVSNSRFINLKTSTTCTVNLIFG